MEPLSQLLLPNLYYTDCVKNEGGPDGDAFLTSSLSSPRQWSASLPDSGPLPELKTTYSPEMCASHAKKCNELWDNLQKLILASIESPHKSAMHGLSCLKMLYLQSWVETERIQCLEIEWLMKTDLSSRLITLLDSVAGCLLKNQRQLQEKAPTLSKQILDQFQALVSQYC